MQAKFVRICVMGISIMTSSLGMAAARADFALEEDFSGTNVWNSIVPTLVDREISLETINNARQKLENAENAYISCGDCDDSLGELDRAIEEAEDLLRRSRISRIW